MQIAKINNPNMKLLFHLQKIIYFLRKKKHTLNLFYKTLNKSSFHAILVNFEN
jgi:hypothetical protein